jgi:hypothetical protein
MKVKQSLTLTIFFTLTISLFLMTCTSKSPIENYDVIIKNTNIVDVICVPAAFESP